MSATGSRKRVRNLSTPNLSVPLGTLEKYNSTGGLISTTAVSTSASTPPMIREITRDENHGKPPYRVGGPFSSIKMVIPSLEIKGTGVYRTPDQYRLDTGFSYVYKGGFSDPIFTGDNALYQNLELAPGVAGSLFPSLTDFSPKVYARLRPTLEKAGLAVALAEVRDIPKMLRTTSRGFHELWKDLGGNSAHIGMYPKKVADHFVNHQFGWVPFVKDVVNLIDVSINADNYIQRITAENNTWTKRHRIILEQTGGSKLASASNYAVYPRGTTIDPFVYGTPSPRIYWDLYDSDYAKVWCEGTFKYYRPEFDATIPEYNSAWNTMRRHMMIHGLRINPSVLYKATPWTWLIDWVSSVGDQIQAADDWALDGVVFRDMYLMCHHITKRTLKQYLGFASGAQTLEWNRIIDTKQRQVAPTPYGFNLSMTDLSARQYSILGALGILKFF